MGGLQCQNCADSGNVLRMSLSITDVPRVYKHMKMVVVVVVCNNDDDDDDDDDDNDDDDDDDDDKDDNVTFQSERINSFLFTTSF